MPSVPVKERSVPNHKNIEFYNEIAIDYDVILDKEDSNEVIRKRVKEKFIDAVEPGRVLDFGGGTGRDLSWLINNNYQVVFCEPSEGMRKKAIAQYKESTSINSRVIFLDNDKVDFRGWSVNPPFLTPADAVLSDFAVINCIADLDLLFKSLAGVIKSGGHLMVLMLQHGYQKTWWWKLREFVRHTVSGKSLIINVNYKGHQQTVYVYSPAEIKSAAKMSFEMRNMEALFEFTLFHFVKK